MKRTALALTVILALVISAVAGTCFVKLAQANPYMDYKDATPPPGTAPIELKVSSPQTFTVNSSFLLSFNITVPNGYLTFVTCKTDWLPYDFYPYYQDMRGPKFPSAIQFSKLLAGVPNGIHTIKIYAKGGGGFAEGLTHYSYSLQNQWTINFEVKTNGLIAMPPQSVIAFNYSSGAKIWEYNTGTILKDSPVTSNGYVFICSQDGVISALNASSGAKIWASPSNCMGPIAASKDKVFAGTDENGDMAQLYCFDAFSGKELWDSMVFGAILSSPAYADSLVYVTTKRGSLYCFNATNGETVWRMPKLVEIRGVPILSSPVVSEGTLYFGSTDNNLYAFDAFTGNRLWVSPVGDWIAASPAVAYNNVYVNSWDGSIYCFNATQGQIIWKRNMGYPLVSSPIVNNGSVFLGSTSGTLYALNASTGDEIWKFHAGAAILLPPALLNGFLFISSNDGNFYSIDTNSGNKTWNYRTGAYAWSSPVLNTNQVYAPTPSPSTVVPATAASVVSVVLVGIGLLVYFKKRKR